MTNAFSESASMRPVSVGYLASLGFALPGIVFVAIGLGAMLDVRAGRAPLDAVNGVGLVAFIFMFVLAYGVRLIFWQRVSAAGQRLARGMLTLVLATEVLLAVAAVWLLLVSPSAPAHAAGGAMLTVWFTTLAALCQIATITWLIRYRSE